ncbi:FtsX-like permease family protein [Shewanella canadensis]|uniref:FtsX-like permease family protein n=2 Tax=Shewanella canadensis TaxID=271096 RepID=A0A3S0ITT1_9GAMM|nr:FtsX-like permease family protein [Shewanella canadensis]
MLSQNLRLAWHFFQQQKSASYQRLLRWTQGILMIFIITLSLTSNSIQDYLQNNLQGLLGADAVISQQPMLTQQQLSALSKLTNKIATTQQVSTTLTHGAQWQQAKLKAVDDSYPLQGELLTATTLHGTGQVTKGGPNTGDIWLDARLFASLSLNIGDVIVIAGQDFIVSRVLLHEPDRLMEGHTVAMRAMINPADMNGLGFSAELIRHRYLVNADTEQTNQLIKWQQAYLPAAQVYHKKGNHPLALFWKRTENFLGLASIILFFMAAIAIEQLTQIHMKKDQYFSAICMSLGASKLTGVQVSMFKWLLGIVTLLPAVLLLSTAAHWSIVNWLGGTFSDLQWSWDLWPVVRTVAAISLVFAVFHAPVWFSLYKNSVGRLFHNNNSGLSHWFSKMCSLLVLSGVAVSYSDNGLLTLMMVSAIVITIGLMIIMSWSSLTLGEKLTQQISGLIPFALFMMKQRILSKSTQIIGVGLSAFMLLFTLMLLKDLGASMSSYQREHDGNVIVSQATQGQMTHIQTWAKQNAINIRQSKPYMYAKLIAVNEQRLAAFTQKPSDSLATLSNAIRLHWTQVIPANNRVVSGQWWQSNSQDWQQVSIEQEIMTDLGLTLGDSLTFVVGQQSIKFTIAASHEFKPGGGSMTFWVQMPPAALAHIGGAHFNMASMELSDQQFHLLTPLWQKFPTLRMTSLKEMTARFDNILAMITKVISGFSLMIILLASVVILASVNALELKEKKKNSIIMSFGFTRGTCFKLNIIEWLVTAGITAAGAILGTYIAGLLIYQSQFSLTYQPDFIWLLLTLSLVLCSVTCFGIYASRHSLRSSVRTLMSEA